MTGIDGRGNIASLGEMLLALPESLDLLTSTSTSPERVIHGLFPSIVVVIAASEYKTGGTLAQDGDELKRKQT